MVKIFPASLEGWSTELLRKQTVVGRRKIKGCPSLKSSVFLSAKDECHLYTSDDGDCKTTKSAFLHLTESNIIIPTVGGALKHGWSGDIAVTNQFVLSKIVGGAKFLYKGGIEYSTGARSDGDVVAVVVRVSNSRGEIAAVGRWEDNQVEIWTVAGDKLWLEYDDAAFNDNGAESAGVALEDLGGGDLSAPDADDDCEDIDEKLKSCEIEGSDDANANQQPGQLSSGGLEGDDGNDRVDGAASSSLSDIPPPAPPLRSLRDEKVDEQSMALLDCMLNLCAFGSSSLLKLPMVVSKFYEMYLLRVVSARVSDFDVRQTRWRRAGAFFEDLDFVDIKVVVNEGGGDCNVAVISSINKRHADVVNHKARNECYFDESHLGDAKEVGKKTRIIERLEVVVLHEVKEVYCKDASGNENVEVIMLPGFKAKESCKVVTGRGAKGTILNFMNIRGVQRQGGVIEVKEGSACLEGEDAGRRTRRPM